MINKIIKLLSFTLMSSTGLFSSSIVISDESLASEQIENIVVTATRNEQQQQDIAGAITRSEEEEISLTFTFTSIKWVQDFLAHGSAEVMDKNI